MSTASPLHQAYQLLYNHYGPQGWWPAEDPLEVMVGAVLTQNTAWRNVERAIHNLKEADGLSLAALVRMPDAELEELIRPAGYFRVKTRRLKSLLTRIDTDFDGDLDRLLSLPTSDLRQWLLAVHGIGPETADSILLYAALRPVFVVDAYTARMVKRHGWLDMEADYHSLQTQFHEALPEDVPMFNEYHALIVRVGKEFCRPTPRCDGCPLESLLPGQGPCEP